MPTDTLRVWDEARRRSDADPDNAALREAALVAEINHLRTIGVDVRRPGMMSRIVPAAVVLILIAIGVGVLTNAKEIRDSQKSSCVNGNAARVASIEEKKDRIDTLNKQLRFWNKAERLSEHQPETPLTPLFLIFVQSLREERDNTETGIDASIAARAADAVAVGSVEEKC